jgi:hypothetical protein
VNNGTLHTAEWNVQAAMGTMNFTRSQTSLVMSSSNIQWFSAACISSRNGTSWSMAIARTNPGQSTATQNLVIGLENFTSVEWHVTGILAGDYFGGQAFALVEGATDVDWRAIGVISSIKGVVWQACNYRLYFSLLSIKGWVRFYYLDEFQNVPKNNLKLKV